MLGLGLSCLGGVSWGDLPAAYQVGLPGEAGFVTKEEGHVGPIPWEGYCCKMIRGS